MTDINRAYEDIETDAVGRGVLERKLANQREELALAQRELDDMQAQLKTAERDRPAMEARRSAREAGDADPGVDLQDELSDRASPLRFMMPPAAQFAEAMGRYGVGQGVRVVLYDRFVNMWAARVWTSTAA